MTATLQTTEQTTPTVTQPTFQDVLESELERARNRFETAQRSFLSVAQTNPAQAIEWQAADVIAAQERFKLTARLVSIIRTQAQDAPTAHVVLLRERDCQRTEAIEFYQIPASTCAYSNAMGQTQCKARMEEIGTGAGVYQRLLDRLAEAV
jgi:hypothetical protein